MVLTKEERVRRKRDRDRMRSRTKVCIGDCFEEWRQLAEEKQLDTDRNVCRFLLDYYKEKMAEQGRSEETLSVDENDLITFGYESNVPTSTQLMAEQGRSEETLSVDENDLITFGYESNVPSSTPKTASHRRKRLRLDMTPVTALSYHPDQPNLTFDSSTSQINEEFTTDDSVDKEDPSFHLSTVTAITDESVEYMNHSDVPSNQAIVDANVVKDLKNIMVTEANIFQLASISIHKCSIESCKRPTEMNIEKIGTACVMRWVCEEGHVSYKWHSQPQLKYGTYCGDIMFASAVLLSGNNFEKISLFFHFLQFEKIVSTSTCNAIQKNLVCPVVEEYWDSMLQENLNRLPDEPLILCGDGRNDSPGHCSQYLTYTVMSHNTMDILAVIVIDKRQTKGNSPNMERLAFKQALDMLLARGLNVVEVVTDQHPGIIGLMKREYTAIKHSFDIWHVAKNLAKRGTKLASKTSCKELLPWIPDIVRHFWWVTKECNGNVFRFKEMWRGVLHHIQGRHEWLGADGSTWSCQHDEDFLERQDLLKPGTPAFKAAQSLVLETRFLKLATHFVNFRKTGTLEVFHQLILKYCSKRYAFSYPVYKARNFLAAIDYSKHQHREYVTTRNDKKRLCRKFNKRSKRWFASQVKEPKHYSYAKELMEKVFTKRSEFEGSLTSPKELLEDDPRRIAPNITGVIPEATDEIWRKQISRF